MKRLQSRKLWVTVITGLIVVASAKFKLGLDNATIQALAVIVASYVIGQSWVDAKNSKG